MAKVAETKVWTNKVRLTFCNLFAPRAMSEGAEPKYGVTLLIPKSDAETIKCIKRAFKTAAENGKSSKFGGKIPANLSTTLRDGDEERDTEAYPEYKDHMFISLSSKQKPGVVDKNRDDLTDPDEIYSGCYGRVSLNAFAYNTAGKKGVSAGLVNVQKLADGDSLTGRVKAEDDFDAWDDEDEEDDYEI